MSIGALWETQAASHLTQPSSLSQTERWKLSNLPIGLFRAELALFQMSDQLFKTV